MKALLAGLAIVSLATLPVWLPFTQDVEIMHASCVSSVCRVTFIDRGLSGATVQGVLGSPDFKPVHIDGNDGEASSTFTTSTGGHLTLLGAHCRSAYASVCVFLVPSK